MATPTGDVWPRDPHTGAKHDLLRQYLLAWLPILFTTHDRLTYAEGFAGPGVYTKGEPGSPVIALEVIGEHRDLLTAHPYRRVDVVFVEEHAGRHRRLQRELAQAVSRLGSPPRNVTVHPPVRADCADALPGLLTGIGSWGNPMLVILDSFGGPDVPFSLLHQVARNPSGEALVTFGPEFLTRHGSEEHHADSGDTAFGGRHWRAVLEQPSDKKWDYLVDAYRHTLHLAGFKHVLSFEMVDEKGHELWLMFGTSSRRGLEKMKDAMWKVDPAYGVRYRDPRDPNQMTLDIEPEPDTAPLGRMLGEAVASGPKTLDELRDYALFETVYRPAQVRGVVQELLRVGHLTRSDGGQLRGDSPLRSASHNGPISQDRAQQLFLDL